MSCRHVVNKAYFLGRNTASPTATAAHAATSAAPAATSFTVFTASSRPGMSRSHSASKAVLNASADITAPIARAIAAHSQAERPSHSPAATARQAAAQCILAFRSRNTSARMPAAAHLREFLRLCLRFVAVFMVMLFQNVSSYCMSAGCFFFVSAPNLHTAPSANILGLRRCSTFCLRSGVSSVYDLR